MTRPIFTRGIAFRAWPILAWMAASLAQAATITVTTTSDEYGTGVNCSLREAITAANTNAAFGGCPAGSIGADTIVLPAGTYTLTIPNVGANEDNNASGDLDINESLTIQGAGAATTIIQAGTDSSNGIDKVIAVNPLCINPVNVTIDGVTVRYGHNTQAYGATDYSYTGAGIDWCAGGGGTFTLSNSVVSDNTNVYGYGGGLNLDSSGGSSTVNITNVSFLNNVITNDGSTNQGTGAGINIFTGQATVNITNCTFSGNQTQRINGSGGAIAYRPASGGALTISTSSFTNNSAQYAGGGVYDEDSWSPSLNVHYSRFVGNTAPHGSGLYRASSNGTISTTNNWWGCSTGPAASPCDLAETGGGPLNDTPWLRDQLTASPSPLATNQSTTLTASFLTDSAGAGVALANLVQLIGRSVSWNASGGTLSGTLASIQASGTATGSFQASAPGTAVLSTRVDNDGNTGSNVLNLTVNKADTTSAITSDLSTPSMLGASVTVAYGVTGAYGNTPTTPTGNVTVTDGVDSCIGTVAAGSCTLSFNTPGARTVTASYGGDGNFNASPASAGVAHNVSAAPVVTTQAISAIAAASATGNGNITATGGTNATARGVIYWSYNDTDQVIGDGGVTNVSESGDFAAGAFTAALTPLAVNTRYNARAYATSPNGTGYGVRVAFWTLANVPSAPTVNSPGATTLHVAVNANGNPAGTEFCIQETGTGSYVQASGALGVACAWQTAATWGTKTVTGLTTGNTYTFQVKAHNGGSTETAYGATASGVPVPPPTITSAAGTTFTVGSSGTFTVTTTGTPTPVLARSGALPGGVSFTDNGNGTATLAGTPGAGTGGVYSLTITANNGVSPDATQNFTLTVNQAPSVATHPLDQSSCTGGNASFTAAAGGYPAPTVRWQLDSGSGFADVSDGGVYSGATTPTLSITGATAGMTGYRYQAVFTNSVNTATTNPATLTVRATTSLTVSNAGDSGAGSLRQAIADSCPGDSINFAANVTGSIALATQLSIDKDLSIVGPGAGVLTLDGGGSVPILVAPDPTSLSVTNLTLANGVGMAGGAIVSGGPLAITDCAFINNAAPAMWGGAIYAAGSSVVITASEFSGNVAPAGGAIATGAANTMLTNVTLSGNTAGTNGGAILAMGGMLGLVNSTVASNAAASPGPTGGGIAAGNAVVVTLRNSIVADNAGGDCTTTSGSFVADAHSIDGDGSCDGATTRTAGELNLGALADNGGPTRTMKLLAASLAIDAGDAATCATTDQRGLARPQGAGCDVGAFERGIPAALTAVGGTPQSTPASSGFATPLTARVADGLGDSLDGISIAFTGPASGAGVAANGTVTSDVSGSAAFTATANGTAGSYVVSASVGSLTASFNLTNNQASPSIALTRTTGTTPSTYGDSLTLTATLSGGANPTGSVNFQDNGSSISGCSARTVSAGVASCAVATLSVGIHANLIAVYGGDGNNAGGTSNALSQTVNQATPILSWAAPTPIAYGTALSATQLNASANVAGAFAYNPPPGTVLSAGSHTLNVTFTPTDTTDYSSAGTSVALTVNKASQTISFGAAPIVVVGHSATVNVTAGASTSPLLLTSSNTGICTVSGTTVTGVAVGTCTLNANQAADSNYDAASLATLSFSILAAPVTSVTGNVGTGTITAGITGGGATCSFASYNFSATLPATAPAGATFPHGVFGFTLTGCTSPVTLNLSYPTALPSGSQYWKYGPTTAGGASQWYVMPGSSVAGTSASFTLTDGALGDDDFTANGNITDAGGPAWAAAAVGATGIPTLSEWGLILLSLLLGLTAQRASMATPARDRISLNRAYTRFR